MIDPAEVAADILTGMLGDMARLMAQGSVDLDAFGLSDHIINALSDADARSVLAAMSGMACVLLESVSQHTGSSSEDILAAIRGAG